MIEMSDYWDGFWTGIAIAFFGSQLYFLYFDVLGYGSRKSKICHTKAESEEKKRD